VTAISIALSLLYYGKSKYCQKLWIDKECAPYLAKRSLGLSDSESLGINMLSPHDLYKQISIIIPLVLFFYQNFGQCASYAIGPYIHLHPLEVC
jgi:hypothetical protein